MSYAPKALLNLRAYLLPITGLPAVSIGIVGDPAHNGGYHCGWDRHVSGDYSFSVARDLANKSDAASAIDIGMFPRLREMTLWLVAQCAAGAPDTKDIREIIYSPDGKVVKRWDREGKSTTGDSSHLTHTHISFYRDAEGRDKVALFRRFFEGDALSWSDVIDYPNTAQRNPNHYPAGAILIGTNQGAYGAWGEAQQARADIKDLAAKIDAALNGGPAADIDAAAIIAALDEKLDAKLAALAAEQEARLAAIAEAAVERAVRRVFADAANPDA